MAYRRAAALFTALALIWSVTLLFLCLTDSPPELEGPLGWDKIQHAAALGMLAFFVSSACHAKRKSLFQSAGYGFGYATLLGGTIEILQQTLTTSRQADPYDLAADAAGALFAVAILHLWQRRRGTP